MKCKAVSALLVYSAVNISEEFSTVDLCMIQLKISLNCCIDRVGARVLKASSISF
jgi:hypothetical protein